MNDNAKRFFGYSIYIVTLGYFSIKANYYHLYLKNSISSQYDVTCLLLFRSIFPIIFGLLLALPQFITRFKQKGCWKVDWIMLLPVGIPSLFVVITPIICLLAESVGSWKVTHFICCHPQLVTLAGIVFGYILVASLNRQKLE